MSEDNGRGGLLITEEQMREAGRDHAARQVLTDAINAEKARYESEIERARLDVAKLQTPEVADRADKSERHERRQQTWRHYSKALIIVAVSAAVIAIVNSVGFWMLQLQLAK